MLDMEERRGPSETTSAVRRALSRVARCPCDGPHSVLVVRGFDRRSRERAAHLVRRLRAHADEVTVETAPAPVVAAFGATGPSPAHRCAVLDATGHDACAALEHWRWRANQPERGRLALRLDESTETLLSPGTGLVVRPRRGRLEVETVEDSSAGHLWAAASRVLVRQVDGLHLLSKDGVLVDDAPPSVCLVIDDRGAARRVD